MVSLQRWYADDKDDFEVNHAISFAHYVASLPLDSPFLSTAAPRLRNLFAGLLNQLSSDQTLQSTSSSPAEGALGVPSNHAHLCEGLLKAVIWCGWSDKTQVDQVVETLSYLLDEIKKRIKGDALGRSRSDVSADE